MQKSQYCRWKSFIILSSPGTKPLVLKHPRPSPIQIPVSSKTQLVPRGLGLTQKSCGPPTWIMDLNHTWSLTFSTPCLVMIQVFLLVVTDVKFNIGAFTGRVQRVQQCSGMERLHQIKHHIHWDWFDNHIHHLPYRLLTLFSFLASPSKPNWTTAQYNNPHTQIYVLQTSSSVTVTVKCWTINHFSIFFSVLWNSRMSLVPSN